MKNSPEQLIKEFRANELASIKEAQEQNLNYVMKTIGKLESVKLRVSYNTELVELINKELKLQESVANELRSIIEDVDRQIREL